MTERPALVTDKHLKFLDELRLSGEGNMHSESASLMRWFGLTIGEARTVLKYWMDSFAERHPEEV